MRILIPKEKALKMLRDRLNEIKVLSFVESQAWKSRTAAEVESIFPILDSRHFEVGGIFFGTQYVQSFFDDVKNSSIELIKSYISWIEENIIEPKVETQEIDYKKLYQMAEQEKNNFQKSIYTLKEVNQLLTFDISNAKGRIQELETNTVQIDNLSLNKFWFLMKQLPIKDFYALIVAFFSILGLVYWLGTLTISPSSY